ncbi:MAG: ATP-binding cassette domain-containing protein, partial [Candidatus Omnitrophota bacterium]
MTIKNNFAIELHHVFETYSLEIKTEKQLICEKFEALKDISFSVNKSEAIAIIGSNGAGKSTLLRIIAGLLKPEKGQVEISGRVSSLLDLGAGFHPEMTGRDNLLLNASLYNFNREEMRTKIEQVLLFADIGKFIDIPVRCYSQGMYVRLAFSLAIHVDPDIILIDDCLAVGDDNFRLKCIDKVLEFKSKGKTIILVTHDFSTARQVCERGIYLKDGRIYRDASLDDVIHSYITPLVIDKNCYKYLGAKITVQENLERDRRQREADQQRMEQEAWRHAQEEQNYLEQKAWRHAQDERNHLEQEAWRHAQEERNRLEQEAWRHAQEERNRLEQE